MTERVFVDSTVWIDFLRGAPTAEAEVLAIWLDAPVRVVVGDLVLVEVLSGCDGDRDVADTLALMSMCEPVDLCGRALAIETAANYRRLRGKGITVRKAIDTIIATWCIANDVPLLHNDRDFDPFVRHLGLRDARSIH